MKNRLILLGALVLCMLSGCDNDNDVNTELEPAKILSFEFLAIHNDDLQEDVTSVIDQVNKTITITLPANTPVMFMRATIKLSDGARVFPGDNFPKDFTTSVTYAVSGDNLSDSEYTVIVVVERSKESKIDRFSFFRNENPDNNLKQDIQGSINGNTINVVFNAGADLKALTPNIQISRGATISPDIVTKQNFINPVDYVVTAQDGITKSVYTVVSTLPKNNENAITSFRFTDVGGSSYEAIIDESDITLELPEGVNLNSLSPTIDISLNAVVVPESGVAQNFDEILQYEVTAEDGTVKVYNVNVYTQNSLNADRAVLTEFYMVNKKLDNLLIGYLNWDLSAPNMNDWEGVTIKNNRVTSLITIFDIRIYELPTSIGKLTALKTLSIGSRALTEVPREIGSLKELLILNLSSNIIRKLPKEIGSLTNLLVLSLSGNKLETIPEEIKNLKKLGNLHLDRNELVEIPKEIGALTSLVNLHLEQNPMTIIPKEVCALSDENGGLTKLYLDINDICEE